MKADNDSKSLELLHPTVKEVLLSCNINAAAMSCDPSLADTVEFCAHYKFSLDQTCNTIIAAGKGNPPKFACCVILASCKLDVNKAVCRLLEIKKCSFAGAEQTKELTGMEIGGVTPLGVSSMPIFVDARVLEKQSVVLGGGNRTSKLLLAPIELKKIENLTFVDELAILR